MMWLLLSVFIWLLMPFNLGAWIELKLRKPPKIPKHKKALYDVYIKSPEWQLDKRLQRLKKDRHICQVCPWWRVILGFVVKPKLQVHHKTYKRVGFEWLIDLITLCRKHHNKLHKRK